MRTNSIATTIDINNKKQQYCLKLFYSTRKIRIKICRTSSLICNNHRNGKNVKCESSTLQSHTTANLGEMLLDVRNY